MKNFFITSYALIFLLIFNVFAISEIWIETEPADNENTEQSKESKDTKINEIEIDPFSPEAVNHFANHLFDTGDYSRAGTEYLRYWSLYSHKNDARTSLFMAGMCFEKSGEFERARTYYNLLLTKTDSPVSKVNSGIGLPSITFRRGFVIPRFHILEKNPLPIL
jgi:hypothetical protein